MVSDNTDFENCTYVSTHFTLHISLQNALEINEAGWLLNFTRVENSVRHLIDSKIFVER